MEEAQVVACRTTDQEILGLSIPRSLESRTPIFFRSTSLPLTSTGWFDQHIQALPHSKKCDD